MVPNDSGSFPPIVPAWHHVKCLSGRVGGEWSVGRYSDLDGVSRLSEEKRRGLSLVFDKGGKGGKRGYYC